MTAIAHPPLTGAAHHQRTWPQTRLDGSGIGHGETTDRHRPPSRRRPDRLRRRRGAVSAVATAMLAVAWLAGVLGAAPAPVPVPGGGTGSTAGSIPVVEASHLVRPGDTLWHIARALQPRGGDLRPVVQRLSAERRGRPLRVGERIVLPGKVP